MTGMVRAVFLSYASQDAQAARSICEALRAGGVEVWLDTSELRGGDSWDQKIRRQIRDCALFIPIISATTQNRAEGYFRREWRLAVERTHDISDRVAFLVPVVIDETTDRDADVPESFRNVQWTRLPGGVTPPEFVERVAALIGTTGVKSLPSRPIPTALPAAPAPSTAPIHKRPSLALIAVALVALVAVSYIAWLESRGSSQLAAATMDAPGTRKSGPTEHSVAVLPFVNMSSEKEQEYFSDGLSEELIDMLSKVPDLRVPARTSSFYFKGKNETIETMAKQLRVENLLEGSVRKAGERLRITAQLIRADNGFHVWSETYDRDAKDVFKVQDEIAAAVVQALKVKLVLGQQGATSHRTSNAEAYNDYLLGRQLFNQGAIDTLQRSLDAYKRAIALDPDYAAAYAGLALSESTLADVVGDSTALEHAKFAANKAVELGPAEPDAYAVRGFLRFNFDWDWEGAKADLEKAISLDPSDSDAQRRYGDLLSALGRQTESIAAIKQALVLDPLAARTWDDLANAYAVVHDFANAHEAMRRAVEINPASPYALSNIGTLQLLEGKFAEALKSFGKSTFEGFQLPGVAMAEHSLGNDGASRRALDAAAVRVANFAAYQIAEAYAWRGEKDRAFEWLERAYRQHDGGLVSVNTDPLLASLRGDPRYKSLLRKMRLPE